VHGVLPPAVRALDNARAIAVGADGRTFAAYLDPKGGFTLSLPVGHAYRIVFANSRADGSEVVLGHMIVNTSHGKEEFFGARAGSRVELGAVAPVATRSSTGV